MSWVPELTNLQFITWFDIDDFIGTRVSREESTREPWVRDVAAVPLDFWAAGWGQEDAADPKAGKILLGAVVSNFIAQTY